MRNVLFTLLVILLLICTVSCADTPDTTESVSTAAPVTTTPIITTAEITTELLPPRSFDEDAIYAHVFENHAVKTEWLPIEEYELDLSKQEAIVTFQFYYMNEERRKIECYRVEGVTTDFYPTGTKYSCYLSPFMPYVTSKDSLVAHDYHEAYLDIMLKHLTFSVCEAAPHHEEYVYDIGGIEVKATGKKYKIYSDGHLYHLETAEDGTVTTWKSDATVDAAYLFSILATSYEYALNSEGWIKRYVNETIEVPEGCESKEYDGRTYWMDRNGLAYYQGPECILRELIREDGIFSRMGYIYHISCTYEDAEENGLFEK